MLKEYVVLSGGETTGDLKNRLGLKRVFYKSTIEEVLKLKNRDKLVLITRNGPQDYQNMPLIYRVRYFERLLDMYDYREDDIQDVYVESTSSNRLLKDGTIYGSEDDKLVYVTNLSVVHGDGEICFMPFESLIPGRAKYSTDMSTYEVSLIGEFLVDVLGFREVAENWYESDTFILESSEDRDIFREIFNKHPKNPGFLLEE